MDQDLLLTTIFCNVDDFCKGYLKFAKERQLEDFSSNHRMRSHRMTLSEIMTLHIYYGACSKEFKTFRAFYENRHAQLLAAFPGLVSYGRAIELKEKILLLLIMFFISFLAPCTGITYGDSTSLKACNIKRASNHKTLRSIARFGKNTSGWFYGTKLHLFLNEYSEIVTGLITPGNIADNNHNLLRKMSKKLWGKFCGDKGYIIRSEFWEELYKAGLQVIHGLRSNMQNKLMTEEDKYLLRKRANVSEGGFSMLKDRQTVEYTRVRSIYGFFSNVVVMLTAYQFWAKDRAERLKGQNKKPRISKKRKVMLLPDVKNPLLATC